MARKAEQTTVLMALIANTVSFASRQKAGLSDQRIARLRVAVRGRSATPSGPETKGGWQAAVVVS